MKTLFENIRPAICQELEKATTSIYVAVAWFTDSTFFRILENKLNENVQVRVFLVDDEINFGNYGLDFTNLENKGAKIHKITETLVHHKFCIVDKKVVLTGSYNWTNKAATKNRENVVIVEDAEYIQPYLDEFEFLCQKYAGTTNKNELGANLKIISLHQQIKFLEEIISQLETEKQSVEQKINHFIHLLHLRLDHLFKKLIDLKEKIAHEIAIKTEKKEDYKNWEQAKSDKKHFESAFEDYKQKSISNQKKEKVASLKKLFKEIVKRCHPDKVQPKHEKAATELFKKAQQAFEDGNEELLNEILEKLEKGIAFDYNIESINDVEFLEQLLLKVQKKESELLEKLENLQRQQEWKIITTYDDVEVYFSEQEILLNEQIKNGSKL
ncbi:MAG: hypothetical protein COZ18_02320 [Flexibacter sp. CG_4_10_14_3_um_filter_32_15]|nr:MAG: hypothetical protein COZ18_02320 [Flexibacter sp. CG_4_10_14_3_um_filter_32_15]